MTLFKPPELLLETSRFRVMRQWYTTPDGAKHVRETVVHPGAVSVIPVLDDQRICLIRNYRPSVDQTLIELPAGTLGQGEDPLVAARRELEEETGYQAVRCERLCEFFMSPGILSERMHLFLATGLVRGPTRLEAGEQIDPCIVDWDEALAMTHDGRIRDAKTLAGLLWFDRWRKAT